MSETSLNYIDSAFDEFNDIVINATADNAEDLALDIYSRVTLRNPVDTGLSRAAWNISVNSQDETIPSQMAKVLLKKQVRGETPKHRTTYRPARVTSLHVPPFAKIYITNSLPYVLPLEGGSSIQAPMGMMAVSVEEVFQRANSGV